MIGNKFKTFWKFYLPLWLSGLLVVTSVIWFAEFSNPRIALAAIAFDNKTSACSTTGASSLTYSFTVNSNTNGLLVVGVEYTESSVTVATTTYAGSPLTFIRRDNSTANTNIKDELWYMVAPATGANNVVVTMSGAVSAANVIISGAMSFTGVDQANPLDANAGGGSSSGGTTASKAITTVANNSWIVAVTGNGNGAVDWTSSETLAWSKSPLHDCSTSGTSNSSGGAYFGPQTPAGSKTMSETLSIASNWSISVASFAPAAAAATIPPTHQVIIIGLAKDKPRYI